jgi:hypothetical protein
LFAGGIAGIALAEAIPFNRVWSFPKKIILGPFRDPWDALKIGDRFTMASTMRKPARYPLEIGDVLTIQGWDQPFVVHRIVEGKIELYAPNLLMRGISPDKIHARLCGQFLGRS